MILKKVNNIAKLILLSHVKSILIHLQYNNILLYIQQILMQQHSRNTHTLFWKRGFAPFMRSHFTANILFSSTSLISGVFPFYSRGNFVNTSEYIVLTALCNVQIFLNHKMLLEYLIWKVDEILTKKCLNLVYSLTLHTRQLNSRS